MIISIILSSLIAYLLGSINFAIIITKLFSKKDIRDYGSKNAGMTNVLRNFGKLPAILTLLGDFLKGVLAIFIGNLIFKYFGQNYSILYHQYIVAFFAIIGHIFPLYYMFKGGKGIAISAGIILMLDPIIFIIVVSIFIITFLIFKMVSIASIISVISFPIIIMIFRILDNSTFDMILSNTILSFILAIIIFFYFSNYYSIHA